MIKVKDFTVFFADKQSCSPEKKKDLQMDIYANEIFYLSNCIMSYSLENMVHLNKSIH